MQYSENKDKKWFMFPIISMNMWQWELRYTMSKMLKDGIKGFDSLNRSRIYLLDNNKKKKH